MCTEGRGGGIRFAAVVGHEPARQGKGGPEAGISLQRRQERPGDRPCTSSNAGHRRRGVGMRAAVRAVDVGLAMLGGGGGAARLERPLIEAGRVQAGQDRLCVTSEIEPTAFRCWQRPRPGDRAGRNCPRSGSGPIRLTTAASNVLWSGERLLQRLLLDLLPRRRSLPARRRGVERPVGSRSWCLTSTELRHGRDLARLHHLDGRPRRDAEGARRLLGTRRLRSAWCTRARAMPRRRPARPLRALAGPGANDASRNSRRARGAETCSPLSTGDGVECWGGGEPRRFFGLPAPAPRACEKPGRPSAAPCRRPMPVAPVSPSTSRAAPTAR